MTSHIGGPCKLFSSVVFLFRSLINSEVNSSTCEARASISWLMYCDADGELSSLAASVHRVGNLRFFEDISNSRTNSNGTERYEK